MMDLRSPDASLTDPSLPVGPRSARRPLFTVSFLIFRIALAVYGIGLLTQGVLAGQFLDGVASARTLHSDIGMSLSIPALVALIAAILVWRSRGPWLPALLSLVLTVGTFAQVAAGVEGNTAVHVPLAIVLVGLTAFLAMWSRSAASGVR
jgi:hypothetical protein